MYGEASGLNSAVRQLGSALGTTILGTVFLSIVTSTMTTNINESDILSNDIKTELIQSVQASSGFGERNNSQETELPESISSEIETLSNESILESLKDTFLIGIGVTAISLLVSFGLPKKLEEEIEG
ncbi:MAG: hypothetical protein Q9M91_06285 [Candidatus Dojkabacteria bacterium]|nr:hypothetical protein [Candidatus Dojkabacteria bacterium]